MLEKFHTSPYEYIKYFNGKIGHPVSKLKPVQTSFLIFGESDQNVLAPLMTNSLYAVFNGIEFVKSIEFIGIRSIDSENSESTRQRRSSDAQRNKS